MPYKYERLRVIYQLGLDFRFDDKPEVVLQNHRAVASGGLGFQFLDEVFYGESGETKIKYAHACA